MAADDYGHWLYSPKGSVFYGYPPDADPVEWEVGRAPGESEGTAELFLIPSSGWWVAKWYLSAGRRAIAVDICVPAAQINNEWTFVDLELDPFWIGGSISVHDEQEFASAIESGLISTVEAQCARDTSDQIVAWMRDAEEPFGQVGWYHFNRALASELQPIQGLGSGS